MADRFPQLPHMQVFTHLLKSGGALTKETTAALGLCFLAFSSSCLLGATTAGAMFDRTGDYCLGLLVMAGLAGVGAALLGPMAVLQARSQKKI